MFELICHHAYTWKGLPADKSGCGNHGAPIDSTGALDGAAPGSGVATFPQPHSRIEITPNDNTRLAWVPLTAVRVEVLARMDPFAKFEFFFVDAHNSFRFGVLEGALAATFTNTTGKNNFIRTDNKHAIDGRYHQVPANRWVKLGFEHDGFAKMRLFVDGDLVAEALTDGSVPGVQQGVICIGNALGGSNRQFPGELDELQIWRLDPRLMKREFLGRPFTESAAECWENAFAEVIEWGKKNPEQLKSLSADLRSARYDLLRKILLAPRGDRARLNANAAEFSRLWFSGQLSGQEMRDILCEWATLMRRIGIDPANALPGLHASTDGPAPERPALDNILQCDPDLARFLELLKWAAETCGSTAEAQS